MNDAGADLLRKAIAQEPSNADAHHSLGLALVRQKNYADALAELRKTNELAPDKALRLCLRDRAEYGRKSSAGDELA